MLKSRSSEISFLRVNESQKAYDMIDDEYKDLLWGIRLLRLENAWSYLDEKKLNKIKVAIIDSGIDLHHEDINRNDIVEGYNFIDNTDDISDSYGHGTAVVGIIAAKKNNRLGIAGVASGVKLYPLKVINDAGKANIKDTLNAIEWAISKNVDIINISLGYSSSFWGENDPNLTNREIEIVNEAIKNDIIIVASVGNNCGRTMDNPAAIPGVLNVASYGVVNWTNDFYDCKSNSKTNQYTIYAPGIGIYTTLPGNQYAYKNGASFATSFVTGAIALLKAYAPQANSRVIKDAIYLGADIYFCENKNIRILNVDKSIECINDLLKTD